MAAATCTANSAACCSLPKQQGVRARQQQRWRRLAFQPLADIALVAEPMMQEVLVGGALVSAVGAALFNGMKDDPKVCELCQGTGGSSCFGCNMSGTMPALSKASSLSKNQRDFLGRSPDPRTCRVCKGDGLLLCSKCNGSGYRL